MDFNSYDGGWFVPIIAMILLGAFLGGVLLGLYL